MVLDYSGRKPVTKNRPRKQPVGIFVIILISAVSMSFALGLLTGWFVFRPSHKPDQGQAPPAAAAASPQQPPYQNPEAGAPRGVDPPLTFYETLPKGGKAIIGSGLNPARSDQPSAPAVPPQSPPQQPAVQQPPATPAPAKPEERKEQGKAPAEQVKKEAGSAATASPKQDAGKFCVQIASSQDRKEAEMLKGKLEAKGLPAYVVESKIKDKGTWYRVRVGKHLSQQAAGELAGKAGKGAMVISE